MPMTEPENLPVSEEQPVPVEANASEPSHNVVSEQIPETASAVPTEMVLNTAWPETSPRLTIDTPASSRKLPASVWLLALLIPYAIVATIAVVYLLQQQQRSRTPHILESIPDQGLYEDFFEARQRVVMPTLKQAKEATGNQKIISPTETLGKELLPLKLGETRTVGSLSVTPVAVKMVDASFAYREGKKDVPLGKVLQLELRVKNTGKLIFHPDDVTFNRSGGQEGKPVYTFLEWGRDRYYGPVSDPALEQLSQASCPALLPGQEGTILVTAWANQDQKKQAVDAIKEGQSGIWRVHLRSGKEDILLTSNRKRSVWVTTVVPVLIQASEIKSAEQ
jgi:hypothetical protein